jgi:hypothetical protein
MAWHRVPKNDDWKACTIAAAFGRRQSIWVHCVCGHQRFVEPSAFAADCGVDLGTPLLSLAMRLRCTVCNEKKVFVWPAPQRTGY